MITNEEIDRTIEKVCKATFNTFHYLPHQHSTALKKIADILKRAYREQLLAYQPRLMVMCIVRILFYYEVRSTNLVFCSWQRRGKIRLAKQCFSDLLRIYSTEKAKELAVAVFDVIYVDKIWKLETFCSEIVHTLLERGVNGSIITQTLWYRIETLHPNHEEARPTIQILYELLEVYTWPNSHETVLFIDKILNLFYDSVMTAVTPQATDSDIAYKKGLEVCIRNMIKRISNDHILIVIQYMCLWTIGKEITDDIILEFGCTLEYAAYLRKVLLYEQTLTPKIFPLLMAMIASESKVINLLGNRVTHYLLDRNENKVIFDTPRIFFENAHSNLRVGECYKEDKLFYKINREILHDSLLKSMIIHSDAQMNLKATYCTICLIATEVPCGFSAAAIVCYAMNLQDMTLKRHKEYSVSACHIHATVIAIMSLLCWVHKATVFYDCVSKIMMERAQWAPHLNPPIQFRYDFAVHHVLWDKPDLFFVDWEARYGLWKCFRLRENPESTEHHLNDSTI